MRLHLLLSHTHADHIQGLPFFLPAFTPGSHITVYGPSGMDRGLPTTVIVDRQGQERARLEGAAEWDTPAMLAAIRRLTPPLPGAPEPTRT